MVLASASPRRQVLVALLGLAWRVAPANIDEEALLVADPTLSAIRVALAKSRAMPVDGQEVILAADTLVVIDGDILGKPSDASAARAMLERLRGRAHQVLSGVVLQRDDLEWAAVVSTWVVMRDYRTDELDRYIERGEPLDKAGGYAVQDQTFRPVERLEGCYLNVVGLPLCAVTAGLNALGVGVALAGTPPCAYCERGRQLVARSES